MNPVNPSAITPDTPPRERILLAAINQFAINGFNGASTRSIAHEAGTNVAMISYYYGSKKGLLEAAVERYFERIAAIVQGVFTGPIRPEQQIRQLITAIITFYRSHANLLAVVLNTWSIHVPEITEKKAQSLNQIVTFIEHSILSRITRLDHVEKPALIIGPALVGSMALHFMFKPVIETVRGKPCDDAFYESMIDIISTILIRGLVGGYFPDTHPEILS